MNPTDFEKFEQPKEKVDFKQQLKETKTVFINFLKTILFSAMVLCFESYCIFYIVNWTYPELSLTWFKTIVAIATIRLVMRKTE